MMLPWPNRVEIHTNLFAGLRKFAEALELYAVGDEYNGQR